jgi:hypothetical protein
MALWHGLACLFGIKTHERYWTANRHPPVDEDLKNMCCSPCGPSPMESAYRKATNQWKTRELEERTSPATFLSAHWGVSASPAFVVFDPGFFELFPVR